jgi:hypothetical protein
MSSEKLTILFAALSIPTRLGASAHLHDKGGHSRDYYDLEAAFSRIKGLNVLHLRPGFFMTSFFAWIDPIKSTGKVGGVSRPTSFETFVAEEVVPRFNAT